MENTNKEDRRTFFGPDEETKYFIATPTAEDIRGADWQYSKTFTQCLVEGITTSAEMVDILNRRGIIGDDFEQRAQELADDLAVKIATLEQTTDIDKKREFALLVAQAREELFQWNQRLNGPMNNTAEQISDDARLEYLTSVMTVNEEGNKIWDSYDSYLKEKSQALALRARFEVMLYLQGLNSDFLEQTPEATAMREVEADVVSKAAAAMQAAEAVAEEEKPKKKTKKRSTKKTTTKKKSSKK